MQTPVTENTVLAAAAIVPNLFATMPKAMDAVMSEMTLLSKLVSIQLSEAMLNADGLPKSKQLISAAIDELNALSDKFRGVRLICTRLGFTGKISDTKPLEGVTDSYAVLKDFSIKFVPESGIMSVVLLIEKNSELAEYYSLDSINVSEGTVMFPCANVVRAAFDKVMDICLELEALVEPVDAARQSNQPTLSVVVGKRKA
jgi:hypothetical protein